MIPRTSLSGVGTGTHITERILRSAIEALVGRSWSAPASWLRTAFFWPITWLTIDRLMLIGTSSVNVRHQRGPPVGPVLERLADQPLGGSGRIRIRNPRSDCGKRSIRASMILGATVSIFRSLDRLREISRIARSFTSGFGRRWPSSWSARRRACGGRWTSSSVPPSSHGSSRRAGSAGLTGLRVLGGVGEEDELDVADLDLVVGRQDRRGDSSGSSFRPLRNVKFLELQVHQR